MICRGEYEFFAKSSYKKPHDALLKFRIWPIDGVAVEERAFSWKAGAPSFELVGNSFEPFHPRKKNVQFRFILYYIWKEDGNSSCAKV